MEAIGEDDEVERKEGRAKGQMDGWREQGEGKGKGGPSAGSGLSRDKRASSPNEDSIVLESAAVAWE